MSKLQSDFTIDEKSEKILETQKRIIIPMISE